MWSQTGTLLIILTTYKALENFSKALYGTAGGTYSARVFRPVMHECKFSVPILPMLARPKRFGYIFISIHSAFYAIQWYIFKPRNEHKESLFIQTMFLCHITVICVWRLAVMSQRKAVIQDQRATENIMSNNRQSVLEHDYTVSFRDGKRVDAADFILKKLRKRV